MMSSHVDSSIQIPSSWISFFIFRNICRYWLSDSPFLSHRELPQRISASFHHIKSGLNPYMRTVDGHLYLIHPLYRFFSKAVSPPHVFPLIIIEISMNYFLQRPFSPPYCGIFYITDRYKGNDFK